MQAMVQNRLNGSESILGGRWRAGELEPCDKPVQQKHNTRIERELDPSPTMPSQLSNHPKKRTGQLDLASRDRPMKAGNPG